VLPTRASEGQLLVYEYECPGRSAAEAQAVQAKNATRSWISSGSVIIFGISPYLVESSPKKSA